MGWAEEHRNTVADRWGEKYREGNTSPVKFQKQMERTMKDYGWSEKDIKFMVAIAMGKVVVK